MGWVGDPLELGSYGPFAVLIVWQHSRAGVQVLGCDLITHSAVEVLCGAGVGVMCLGDECGMHSYLLLG